MGRDADYYERVLSDERAMDAIAAVMQVPEWSPDTLDAIAEIVRSTGRDIDA